MDILKLTKNFAVEAVKFIAAGAPIVPEEVFKERLETCNSCEHLSGDKCMKCGCTMSVKCKWGTAACPINKWGAVNTK